MVEEEILNQTVLEQLETMLILQLKMGWLSLILVIPLILSI